MPMNKVVHAAQRAAFSAAIDAAINAVRGKGPENMAAQAVKLVNLAQPLLAHRYPDADWDKVRSFVSDPNSKWMEYAYKAINEIDLDSLFLCHAGDGVRFGAGVHRAEGAAAEGGGGVEVGPCLRDEIVKSVCIHFFNVDV